MASGNDFAFVQAHLPKVRVGRAGGRMDCWRPGFVNAGAGLRWSLDEIGTAGCARIGLASSAVAVRQIGRAH
jgi:hypothetical protein